MIENLKKSYYEGQNGHDTRGLKETLQYPHKLLVMVFFIWETKFLTNTFVPCRFKCTPLAFRCSLLMLEWEMVFHAYCLAKRFTILFTSLILQSRFSSDLTIKDEIVILQSGEWFCIFNPRLTIPSAISRGSVDLILFVPTWRIRPTLGP